MPTDERKPCGECPHSHWDATSHAYRCVARTGGGLGPAPKLQTDDDGNPLRLANCKRTQEEVGGSDV